MSAHSVKVDIGDVFHAFIAGCREARANPTANEEAFERGGDAYVKLLIERAADSAKEWQRSLKIKMPHEVRVGSKSGEDTMRRGNDDCYSVEPVRSWLAPR